MGQSRHPRLWLAVAVAALLAMAAVAWLPAVLPLGTTQSPLPTPLADPPSPSDASSAPLSSLAKVGLTLLWVALGVLVGVGVIFVTLHWHRRSTR